MRLEIYVASHCTGCQEALRIAELAQDIAGLDVAVINLDHATLAHPVPTTIVAVPTYLLDGRIVSLGNPHRDEFLAHLRSYARQASPASPVSLVGEGSDGKEPAP